MNSKFVLLFLIVLNLHQLIFAQKLTKEDCKCRTLSSKRLIGGSVSVPNAYPFHVSLSKKSNFNETFCGGVILNHNQILTKAHCLTKNIKIKDMIIRAGVHDLNSKEGETYTIKKIITDSRFNSAKNFGIGDLAVIFTNEVIGFTDKIQPGCLGKLEENDKKSSFLKIIGWNPTDPQKIDTGSNSGVLKEALVKSKDYSSNDKCFDFEICYIAVKRNHIMNILDGGSALIMEKNGITKVIGINKWTNHYNNAGAEKIEFYKPELDKWTENNYCSVDL